MQAGGECNIIANPEAVKNLKLEFKIMNLRMGGEKVTKCFKVYFYFPV